MLDLVLTGPLASETLGLPAGSGVRVAGAMVNGGWCPRAMILLLYEEEEVQLEGAEGSICRFRGSGWSIALAFAPLSIRLEAVLFLLERKRIGRKESIDLELGRNKSKWKLRAR